MPEGDIICVCGFRNNRKDNNFCSNCGEPVMATHMDKEDKFLEQLGVTLGKLNEILDLGKASMIRDAEKDAKRLKDNWELQNKNEELENENEELKRKFEQATKANDTLLKENDKYECQVEKLDKENQGYQYNHKVLCKSNDELKKENERVHEKYEAICCKKLDIEEELARTRTKLAQANNQGERHDPE